MNMTIQTFHRPAACLAPLRGTLRNDAGRFRSGVLAALFLLAWCPCTAFSQAPAEQPSDELPMIPVGLDAYRMWDRLPYHKIGIRAYMRSTYDRQGNNWSSDASHFLYQESDTFNVTLDVQGQGFLYFKRTNHWHGSPWHYEIDGRDFVVSETATADPVGAKKRLTSAKFLPEDLFPHPLTFTWETTRGADLMWVPLPFEKRLRLAYGRTAYGTGYYIYHLVPQGTKHLSRSITSWDRTPPDPKVLELLNQAGGDIVADNTGMHRHAGKLDLAPHQTARVLTLDEGPAMIRSLKLKIPAGQDFDFGRCRLRITWDNRWHPSIDAPVGLFFGAGELYNAEGKEFLVKGLPLAVRYADGSVHLDCYWPMPFFKNAVIELQERTGATIAGVEYEVYTEPVTGPQNHLNYFHATYQDIPQPEMGKDNVYLDTSTVEGGGEWSGHFVGMSWIFSRDGNLAVLEGDPRFYFDDSQTPQAWGTGCEEWGGGGDHWGGRTMTIPLAGHPIGKRKTKAENPKDLINSAYRFLIADYFPFGKRAVIGLEHGAVNQMNEHSSGVTYWYGVNNPSLVLTDHLNVCHEEDRKKHNTVSSGEGESYSLVSRHIGRGPHTNSDPYKYSADPNPFTVGTVDFFPAHEDRVRTVTGSVQFTAKLRQDNQGVLLRRKFDYLYPNQQAKVSIRPSGTEDWQEVGVWFTAGSNTCVFSRPGGELDPPEHHVMTTDRRWMEEEFAIAGTHTRGHESLDIKLEVMPDNKELYPGFPFPETSAWSESRYWVYSWILPQHEPGSATR
jgi:hypothetical protein